MIEITPAILPESYRELVDKLDIAAGHARAVQVDICDGGYVPSRTWPYLKGPNAEDMIFEEIKSQEQALPHWDIVDFEFDLMVRDAHAKIPDFIAVGASRIVVHQASMMRASSRASCATTADSLTIWAPLTSSWASPFCRPTTPKP
ncbi:MAG TPA: hypothetical protein VFQ72_00090 [Candidatus Paceibacterota bacterium]|nr:hypothetical protein [Candidatus Paceibacterota bacterium]